LTVAEPQTKPRYALDGFRESSQLFIAASEGYSSLSRTWIGGKEKLR